MIAFEEIVMKGKDFLSIADLSPEEAMHLVHEAASLKNGHTAQPLQGKIIALLFEKPSLRTRVSFEVGIRQLGGDCIYLSRNDIGLGTREPTSEVARVLDRWVDGIVARVFSHDTLHSLAKNTSVPVINALSDIEHPCQAIGDLLTIYEYKGRFDGIRVAFIGDGNNVASSLALACASVGADFTMSSPRNHQIPPLVWGKAKKRAAINNSQVGWVETPQSAVQDADAVYTDVWVSMGQESERSNRLQEFADYQVNEELMSLAKPNAVFMHDMPAHEEEEISKGMLDHPSSVVFDQAENRLHAQKAVLARLFS